MDSTEEIIEMPSSPSVITTPEWKNRIVLFRSILYKGQPMEGSYVRWGCVSKGSFRRTIIVQCSVHQLLRIFKQTIAKKSFANILHALTKTLVFLHNKTEQFSQNNTKIIDVSFTVVGKYKNC